MSSSTWVCLDLRRAQIATLIALSATVSTFRRPRNAQLQSRLVRLPAELRIKILRNLLVSDGPIQSLARCIRDTKRTTEDGNVRYAKGVRLSAQVLSTCQILYNEARDILYHENTIEVDITRGSVAISQHFRKRISGEVCAVLDAVVGMPNQRAQYMPIEQWVSTQDQDGDKRGAQLLNKWQSHFLRLYPSLKQFQHWQINLDFAIVSTAAACTMLSQLLRDKFVTVLWTTRFRRRMSIEYGQLIGPLKLWRCKRIVFNGFPDKQLCDSVQAVVEGHTPIQDLHAACTELEETVFNKMPGYGFDVSGLSWRAASRSVLQRLYRAVDTCDSEEYERQKALALALASRWNREASRYRIKEAMAAIQEARKGLVKVRKENQKVDDAIGHAVMSSQMSSSS